MSNNKWDVLTSTTLNHHIPTLVDQVFRGTPLLNWLRESGCIKPFDGGIKIVEPLLIGRNNTASTYDGYDTLKVKPQEGMTAAEYAWKSWAASMSLCQTEELQNSGKAAMINLVSMKLMQLQKSTMEWLNAMLILSDGESHNAVTTDRQGNPLTMSWGERKALCGLAAMLSDAPFGGIDPSTPGCEWWQPLIMDFGGDFDDPGELTYNVLSEALGCLTFGTDRPDLILTDKDTYYQLKAAQQGRQLFPTMTPTAVTLGFQSMSIEGVPVMYDWNVPKGTVYLLNSNYINLRVHSQHWFKQGDWEKPYNQMARYKWISGSGELTTNNRSMHGVICNFVVPEDCFPVRICS
jgi:hypothetical protein